SLDGLASAQEIVLKISTERECSNRCRQLSLLWRMSPPRLMNGCSALGCASRQSRVRLDELPRDFTTLGRLCLQPLNRVRARRSNTRGDGFRSRLCCCTTLLMPHQAGYVGGSHP